MNTPRWEKLTDSVTGEETECLMLSENCECQFTPPYGFVAEEGCKEHDTAQFHAFVAHLLSQRTEEIKKIMKREYLRGIIDGQGVPLGLKYSLEDLEKIYARYTSRNPDLLQAIEERR